MGGWLAAHRTSVSGNPLKNSLSKSVAIRRARNKTTVDGMIDEATFEEDSRDDQIFDDHKPSPLDATVAKSHVAKHRRMHGRGEGDILGITGMAGICLQIAVAEVFLVHRRHAPRSQCKGFNARAADRVAFIKVDAHKNSILVAIGEGWSLLQRNEGVVGSSEMDLVASLQKQTSGSEHHIERGFLLDSPTALGAAVMTSMAGIEDDCGDGSYIFDESGSHYGFDDLGDIHRGDQDRTAFFDDGKTQDVFDVVDEDFSSATFSFDGFCGALDREAIFLLHRWAQVIEFRDVFDRHIAAVFMQNNVPS